MSDVVFRHAAAGEERAVIDFINQNFDMRLPLINRPEFYRHYYAGMGGVPQFVVAEQDGRYLSAAGISAPAQLPGAMCGSASGWQPRDTTVSGWS